MSLPANANPNDFGDRMDPITHIPWYQIQYPVAFVNHTTGMLQPPIYDIRRLREWTQRRRTFPHNNLYSDYSQLAPVRWIGPGRGNLPRAYYTQTATLLNEALREIPPEHHAEPQAPLILDDADIGGQQLTEREEGIRQRLDALGVDYMGVRSPPPANDSDSEGDEPRNGLYPIAREFRRFMSHQSHRRRNVNEGGEYDRDWLLKYWGIHRYTGLDMNSFVDPVDHEFELFAHNFARLLPAEQSRQRRLFRLDMATRLHPGALYGLGDDDIALFYWLAHPLTADDSDETHAAYNANTGH